MCLQLAFSPLRHLLLGLGSAAVGSCLVLHFPCCAGVLRCPLCRFTPPYLFLPTVTWLQSGLHNPLNSASSRWTLEGRHPSHTSCLPGARPSGEEPRSPSHPAQLPWPNLGHCHPSATPQSPVAQNAVCTGNPLTCPCVVGPSTRLPDHPRH